MQGGSVEDVMITCPRCASENCVIPAEKVFESISSMYAACPSCMPDPIIDKQTPFRKLATVLDDSTMRCKNCGKRHLDIVIAHVLDILIREGLRSNEATLFDVGTPMIVIGYPIPFPPRLGRNMLILIMDVIDKKTAEMIVNEVSEVKGVIKRTGRSEQPIGILTTDSTPHIYDLLAGCDLRADIVSSVFGELCIYKTQSDTHIEFSRAGSEKIQVLESLYYHRKLEGTVVDACCGAGTLGLVSVLAGAREVILNDAFLPSVTNTILNIRANASILDLELEIHTDPSRLRIVADAPRLIATAHGSSDVSIYHSDLVDLASILERSDLCLIDAFTGVSTGGFVQAWKDTAAMVVTI
ncbi:hypothetical protein CW696_06075 [ANME-2 cluster archaeon]|nr:MAG: hypothetical protein CW696_06075 [ANME-2 cluster archaeon]